MEIFMQLIKTYLKHRTGSTTELADNSDSISGHNDGEDMKSLNSIP